MKKKEWGEVQGAEVAGQHHKGKEGEERQRLLLRVNGGGDEKKKGTRARPLKGAESGS